MKRRNILNGALCYNPPFLSCMKHQCQAWKEVSQGVVSRIQRSGRRVIREEEAPRAEQWVRFGYAAAGGQDSSGRGTGQRD